MSDDEKYEQYIKDLWPFQQEVIAYAMLAGCTIKKMKFTSRGTVYEAHLPDGTYIGVFPDLYEASVNCKIWLMAQNEPVIRQKSTKYDDMFQPPLD